MVNLATHGYFAPPLGDITIIESSGSSGPMVVAHAQPNKPTITVLEFSKKDEKFDVSELVKVKGFTIID